MTDKEFCENDSSFFGEKTDHIDQIVQYNFKGRELKKYVEHHIKRNLENIVFENVGNLSFKLVLQKNLLPEHNIYGFIRIDGNLYKKEYL
jgi:hypothetical protein